MNISSPDMIEDAMIYIKKFNRTFDVLNSTATFKVWLNDSIFVGATLNFILKLFSFKIPNSSDQSQKLRVESESVSKELSGR